MRARELMGRMRKTARPGLLLAVMLLCAGGPGHSALGAPLPSNTPDTQAFGYALNLFAGEHYLLAETNFIDFLAKYTNSTHRADAVLYLARARLEQSNFRGAIDLLQKTSPGAGGLLAEYDFWIAKAHAAAGDFTLAAEGFATVAQNFPLSPRRLEASYDEAEAFSRTGDWLGVIRRLQQTNGPFQLAAVTEAKSEFVARGWLLLGEALLHEQRLEESEKLVRNLDPSGWSEDLRWRRQVPCCAGCNWPAAKPRRP